MVEAEGSRKALQDVLHRESVVVCVKLIADSDESLGDPARQLLMGAGGGKAGGRLTLKWRKHMITATVQ